MQIDTSSAPPHHGWLTIRDDRIAWKAIRGEKSLGIKTSAIRAKHGVFIKKVLDTDSKTVDTERYEAQYLSHPPPLGHVMEKKYLVRQYRPNFVTGFNNAVVRDVSYEDITKCEWFENFKHSGFKEFVIKPYNGDELIISAHYYDGKHWVVGFALPMDSETMSNNGDLMRDNWRYKDHES